MRDRLVRVDDGFLERGVKIPEASLPSWLTETGFQAAVEAISKEHLNLGNVDNTSDMDKPVSTATQLELDEIRAIAEEAHALASSGGGGGITTIDGGVP
jgi:hypothetical protein